MADLNRVILTGRLTRDVDLRSTRNNTSVAEVGVAINERRKGANGEWEEATVFVDVTLWGRTAEFANEYVGKGSQVVIEGRLKFEQWESNGQKRSKLSVVGERLVLPGGKSNGARTQNRGGKHEPASTSPSDEDIPF